jgi:uncharacterized protein
VRGTRCAAHQACAIVGAVLERRPAAAATTGGAVTIPVPDGVALDARAHPPHRSSATAAVVLAHGINTDLDEGGMYRRLAARLADVGFGVLRFSFRGHGSSTGSPRGATIAGEMLDVEAATAAARARWPGVPLAVVASSMGAVPVIEAGAFLRPDVVVLWNPVLDLRRTFVEPELPWGRENFSADAWATADRDGHLLLDGEFEMGRVLLAELHHYEPLRALSRLADTPTLIVHGNLDSYVSFDIARDAAARLGHDFHTVDGSDHGFDTTAREDEAIDVTTRWLSARIATRDSRAATG